MGGKLAKARVRRKETRPQEIVDAALEVFVKLGFAKTTFSDIAAQGDMARATVYVYYSSKTDIFRACVDKVLKENAARFTALTIPPNLPLKERLRPVLSAVVEALGNPYTLGIISIILCEGREYPELIAVWKEKVLAKIREVWSFLMAGQPFDGRTLKVMQVTLFSPLFVTALIERAHGGPVPELGFELNDLIDAVPRVLSLMQEAS